MSHEIDKLLGAVSAKLDRDAPPISLDEIVGGEPTMAVPTTVVQLRPAQSEGPDRATHIRRRVMVVAAALLLVTGGAIAVATRNSQSTAPVAEPATAAPSSSTAATATTVTTIVETTQPIVKTSLTQTLAKGAKNDDVKAVQQRLTDLGFAPGPIDGIFGSGTQQAVWAYEKLVLKTPRAKATGKVTDEMWQGMQDRVAITPRRPTPGKTHMEIYIPEQVAVVFVNDAPKLIAHISTGVQNPDGTPQQWCETLNYDTDKNGEPLATPVTKQECAEAKTPGGVFAFTRRYAGKRVGPLGGMMNPVYFNYGIAVHGADNVPLEPASHGCVRLNQTIAKFFPSLVKTGDAVFVWGQDGKQPEDYSKRESLPSFNRPDPNATTTTTTTTTTAPPTTTAPTTVPTPTTTPTATTVAPVTVVPVAPPTATTTAAVPIGGG
jgi:L,D-transpeptidase catalytic domain/Putative peptidoglycan binding domain